MITSTRQTLISIITGFKDGCYRHSPVPFLPLIASTYKHFLPNPFSVFEQLIGSKRTYFIN